MSQELYHLDEHSSDYDSDYDCADDSDYNSSDDEAEFATITPIINSEHNRHVRICNVDENRGSIRKNSGKNNKRDTTDLLAIAAAAGAACFSNQEKEGSALNDTDQLVMRRSYRLEQLAAAGMAGRVAQLHIKSQR